MQLRHGTAVIRRAPGTVQVGTDWGRELVLSELTATQEEWLLALGRAAMLSSFPYAAAVPAPPPPAGTLALQIALRQAGYALPRPAMEPRIIFQGLESVICDGIDMALSTGTIGVLNLQDGRPYGRDLVGKLGPQGLGSTREAGVGAYFESLYPWIARSTSQACDLTILTSARSLDHGALGRLVASDEWHLPVLVGERGVLVGPLVIPGRSACARCLALHLSGRDPEYAAAELSVADQPLPRPLAAMQARVTLVLTRFLTDFSLFWRGRRSVNPPSPPLLGTVISILADGSAVEHSLPPHPECGCVARAQVFVPRSS